MKLYAVDVMIAVLTADFFFFCGFTNAGRNDLKKNWWVARECSAEAQNMMFSFQTWRWWNVCFFLLRTKNVPYLGDRVL